MAQRPAAREFRLRQPGEEVETARLSVDGLGDQPAGKRGDGSQFSDKF